MLKSSGGGVPGEWLVLSTYFLLAYIPYGKSSEGRWISIFAVNNPAGSDALSAINC